MSVKEHGEGAMPVIVAWDTCMIRGVIAIARGRQLLAETYFEAAKGHSGWLMPEMDEALVTARVSRAEVTHVACGTGPGTFTGVKVGIACAKAVSMGLGVPVVGMPTLDLLAHAAPGIDRDILAVMDARRGQLYAAAFRPTDETLERLTDYMCVEPSSLCCVAAELDIGDLVVAGEATVELMDLLGKTRHVVTTGGDYPTGGALIKLASDMIESGDVSDAVSVAAIYLKKPV